LRAGESRRRAAKCDAAHWPTVDCLPDRARRDRIGEQTLVRGTLFATNSSICRGFQRAGCSAEGRHGRFI